MFKTSLRFAIALLLFVSFTVSSMAQTKAFDTSRMDTTADACTDFFQYANGKWVKDTPIPPAFPRWGTFNILADNNQTALKDVLENAAKAKSPKGSDSQLTGDLYASCMDEAAIEKADAKPLKQYFKKIDKVKDLRSMHRAIAEFHRVGASMFFGFGSSPDLKNSKMVIATTGQGGMSLPNKDFYTKTDDKSVEIRNKFVAHMTNMFKLLGDADQQAAANAQTVMRIQMRLANAAKAPVELRNPDKNYNKMSLTDVAKLTPDFSWPDYMQIRGVPTVSEMNVGQPDFFKELNKMFTEVSIGDWKTYMRWMVVNSSAQRLSKRFVDENFDFYSRTLTGTKEQQPRWKRCVGVVDGSVGEALGQEFVKKAYTPEARKRMDEMINNIFAVFRERLKNLDWMTEETRQQALKKLSTINRKIGYPDKLRGYQGLVIDRKSYFDNGIRTAEFLIARNLADISQPTDRTRWAMTPPTVNAYYNALNNEIVFPAGILQPPFFNFAADDAINYGGIGGVIGHELGHAFDDNGSRFDADGNLKMWWTPEDRKKFDERASCVIEQFNGYEIQPKLFINGNLTIGENLGDLGGLTVAYEAYKKSLEGKPRPADIDGFTAEQRFFLGWAQVWATKGTPEFERQQVLTDSHSNARYRVNGPTSNMAQFAQAFGCRGGQPMVRANACKVW